MKSTLQAEYGTRDEKVEKLRVNLNTSYGLVLRQCTKYLRSKLEIQEKWETISNERNILALVSSVKSLIHKFAKETVFNHVAYHTLVRLHWLMLF